MTGIVRIGNHEVGMSAKASSPYRYKQVFHKNMLQEAAKGEEADTYIYAEMGYIMARTYERADMNKLSMEDYYSWLDQFEQGDMLTAIGDIARLWSASSATASSAKKKTGRQ